MLQCSQFKQKLETALQYPNGIKAKEMLHLIDQLIRITGSRVHGSPDERKSAISTLISMIQFYGNPSIFFTFAPDDTHSMLTLRMRCPTQKGNDKSLTHNNTLSNDDFIKEGTHDISNSWYSAPLAVTSNSERDFLMFTRAQQWAYKYGVHVITWNIQCAGTVMSFLREVNTEKEIFDKQRVLLSFFVHGAMSYITENV
jgi:Helitron helicase-like domain at N-terminus